MTTNRRDFLKTAALVGCAAAVTSHSAAEAASRARADYPKLDEVLKQPVLKRNVFPDPVTIESVELLRDRKNFLCRARSTDGATGVSVGHPFISKQSYPVFVDRLAPFFTGKDARDLDQLIYRISETSVKVQGVPFCVQLATLEFAILDMLGTMKVARMVQAAGLQITPHISGGGLGYAYMLQMVSVCPAAAEYHEFKMFGTRDANGTTIPVESKAERFESVDGVIKVPSGAGLGVNIDPDYVEFIRK